MAKVSTLHFSAAVADQAQAGQLVQRARRVGQQLGLMRRDRVEPQPFDIVDGGTQGDDAGDVRRAGLELERDLVPGRPGEADPLDHVAAALVGRHGLQMLGPAVEHAHARRPVELVAGEDEKVGAQVLNVDRDVLHGLGCVDQHRQAALVRQAHDLVDRVDRAQDVRDPDHARPSGSGSSSARPRRPGSSSPVSVTGAATTRAPVASATSCQGTMLAWCSISVIRISSPGCSRGRRKLAATRLIASVALRVNTISRQSAALMKRWTLRRAASSAAVARWLSS